MSYSKNMQYTTGTYWSQEHSCCFKEGTLQVNKFTSLLSPSTTPYTVIHKWK